MASVLAAVIGTAGHIDHGKSALVQALTGIDPDRLKEEKDRGLTIDLGFARLKLADGQTVGFIDVPGHERFVKNMVAGSTGIAVALLVIAADDGIMPQTREHLEILQLLQIPRCVVALNKVDLVEADWCELVREDIAENLAETPFAAAPIVEVSAITGKGLPELRQALVAALDSIEQTRPVGAFMMPVQRVFSAAGQGTVLTGVPVRGSLKVGQTVEVRPGGQKCKVRAIQAYGGELSEARAGHSTALCLSGLDYKQHRRGEVVTLPGYLAGAPRFEARLQVLDSAPFPIEHLDELFFHSGTCEMLAKIALLDADGPLQPGSSGFVQIRLPEAVPAEVGDRFILRRPSPARTVGGGTLLAATPWRLKAGKEHVLARLRRSERAQQSELGRLEDYAHARDEKPFRLDEARKHTLQLAEEVQAYAAQLLEAGKLVALRSEKFVHARAFAAIEARILERVQQAHQKAPHKTWVAQLVAFRELDPALAEAAARRLAEAGTLEVGTRGLKRADHEAQLGERETAMAADVVVRLGEGYDTPAVEELVGLDPLADFNVVLEHLLESGQAVRLAGNVLLSRAAVDKARALALSVLRRDGQLMSGEFKNLLKTSRKYALPLLELFDDEGLTLRDGSRRVLRKHS